LKTLHRIVNRFPLIIFSTAFSGVDYACVFRFPENNYFSKVYADSFIIYDIVDTVLFSK